MSEITREEFCAAVEKLEENFSGDCDVDAFRKAMRKLGFDTQTINERIADLHPEPLSTRSQEGRGE